jgi:hypothetical protein
MNYDSLSTRIRERVPRNTYESAPEDLRQMIVMMVEDRIRREDRAAVIQLDDGYQHHEIPPHMNIVQHRYILRPDAPEPDRQEFVRILRDHIHALSQISRYRLRNITVRYDTSDGLAQWFSFSRSNIESMGFDRLVEHFAENEGEWDEDYYGGSDYIRSYLTLRTLNVQEFRIITELVQSGVGEVEYSYYKCIENTEDAENNCLINCFRYLSKKNFEPEKVRYLLGVEPNAMLTLEHIPKLESIFKIKVGVYEDRRTLAFAYKSGKHYYDYKAIIKRDYPIVLYGDLNSPYKILWKNNHSAVIVEEYMARDCHCEYTGIFVGHGNGNKLSKEEIIKELQRQGRIDTDESTIADDDKTTYYYFFDYETVYDPITAELSPYAWALVKYDSEGNHIQTWNDVASNPKDVKSILEVLLTEVPAFDERKYLIGFNNSRFDNYFLIHDC